MQHLSFLTSANSELNIKTLNNVAVEYCELGLRHLSYQIWDELYHEIQGNAKNYNGLMPVVSCNMGNMLRRTGYYEEAYRVLTQGLKKCFDTGVIYAMPELVIQISILWMQFGHLAEANSMYSFGKYIFRWSKQTDMEQSIDEMIDQDFLLSYEEKTYRQLV